MADQASSACSSSSNVVGETADSSLELNIKTLDSQTYTFQVNKNIPVSLFKEKIANEIGVPVCQQRLIFRGRVLKDDHPLSDYHLENGHTLHLVVRQQAQSQPSSDTSSGQTNANQGNDTNDGAPRNRIGQIAHSVVLGTFNVGDQGEGGVPDISRVIGAVLNSFGIGTQPASNGANGTQSSIFSNASAQASVGNVPDGTPAGIGGQSQAGNHSQSRQAFSGQPFQTSPQVVQIPLTAAAAIPIPSVHAPIPDSLDTLSEFIYRMEQAFSQNGYQPDTPSANPGDQRRAQLPRNARGLSTPEALGVVMRNAQHLLGGQAIAALSHIAGRLEQEGASSDPALRGQIQTEAMQVGLAMQHLGALLLELGRTILTLRMGQSSAESYVNAGPAVYISSSGPNPIMVQPFPLQTSSLFSGPAPPSNPTAIGPVGVGTAPRHINIHIHAGTSLSPMVSAVGNRQSNADGGQGEHDNNAGSTGSASVRILPVRNVIAAVPSRTTGVAFSTGAQPGIGVSVSQAPDSASVHPLVAEINSIARNLVNEMQVANQGTPGTESPQQHISAGQGAANEVNEQRDNIVATGTAEEPNISVDDVPPERNNFGAQRECNECGGEDLVCPSSAEDATCSVGESSTLPCGESNSKADGSSEDAKSSKNSAEIAAVTPLGLGLGGLERKKRSKQPKPLVKNDDSGTSAPSQGMQHKRGTSSQQLLQSLFSGSSANNGAGPDETPLRQQPSSTGSQQGSDDHVDVSTAMSQVLESPALDGLLAGISGQTGVGSPNVLRNMLQQFTQNPQIMSTVQQIAQQVDGREIESMVSGGARGGGVDFSRMVQQMMPLVSRAFSQGGPMAASQHVPAAEPATLQRHGETATEVEKPDDHRAFQINVQPVAQMIEHSDPPVDVFRAVVENAIQFPPGETNHEELVNELCNDEVLAHEYAEVLRRDIQRRLQGDSGP